MREKHGDYSNVEGPVKPPDLLPDGMVYEYCRHDSREKNLSRYACCTPRRSTV
jgi:hypothetical protein